jgi:hypothetical protein
MAALPRSLHQSGATQQRRWQALAHHRPPQPQQQPASTGERSGPTAEDRQYSMRALELASRALGQTFPNPAVGCVIVKDGEVGIGARSSSAPGAFHQPRRRNRPNQPPRLRPPLLAAGGGGGLPPQGRHAARRGLCAQGGRWGPRAAAARQQLGNLAAPAARKSRLGRRPPSATPLPRRPAGQGRDCVRDAGAVQPFWQDAAMQPGAGGRGGEAGAGPRGALRTPPPGARLHGTTGPCSSNRGSSSLRLSEAGGLAGR